MLTNMPELGLHLLLIILFINFSVPPFHHLAASPSPAISMGNFNVHGEKSFNTPVSLLPVTFNPPLHPPDLVITGNRSISEILHTSIQHNDYTLPFLPLSPLSHPTCSWASLSYLYHHLFFPNHQLSPDFTSFSIILDPVTSLQVPSSNPHNLSPCPPAPFALPNPAAQGLGYHFHSQLSPQMFLTHPSPLPSSNPLSHSHQQLFQIFTTLLKIPPDLCLLILSQHYLPIQRESRGHEYQFSSTFHLHKHEHEHLHHPSTLDQNSLLTHPGTSSHQPFTLPSIPFLCLEISPSQTHFS